MKSKRLLFAFIGILAVGMGVMFSQRWIKPLMSHDGDHFVPIRYYAHTQSDDYFYYSRIREIIDGNILSGDHATLEYKNVTTPHATYTVSFIAGALGGIFTNKTEHAYYFNYFFFPAASFLALVYLGSLLGIHAILTSSVAIIAMLTAINIDRTPNILITGFFLYFFASLLFLKFETRNPSRWLDLVIAIFLGLSSVTSTPNMFICYGLFLTSWLSLRKENINHRGFAKILLLALVISLPGILVLVASLLDRSPDWFGLAIPPLERYTGINAFYLIPALKMVFCPTVLLLYVLQYPFKRFICVILLSMSGTFLFLLALKGAFTASYVFNRGGEVLYNFTWGMGLLLAFREIVKTGEISIRVLGKTKTLIQFSANKRRNFYISNVLSFMLVLGAAYTAKMTNRYMRKDANSKTPHYFDQQFKGLTNWSQSHARNNEVIVSLDFDVITNIGIYAAWDTYLPFAHHSPVPTPERFQRFYETLAYHGVTTEKLRDHLTNMKSHERISKYPEERDIQSGLMQLILFYGKFTDRSMTSPEVDAMVLEYDKIRKDFKRFSFKADYIIFSNRSAAWEALSTLQGKLPVYESELYRVYKL